MVIADDCFTPPVTPEHLAEARAGDADCFCRLIEPLQPRLLRQAVALTGDLHLAEDILSETLVEAWKSLPRYNESCQLSTWLYAILLHRYHKSVRWVRSRPVASALLSLFDVQDLSQKQENVATAEPSPADTAAQKEAFARLRQCVERLPEKHVRVVMLRFFEEASLPDMAIALGCSIGTVKSRLHHALEKLRKMKMNISELKGDKPI